MRVGIHVASQGPRAGGGYTYVNDILAGLARVPIGGRHELVAVGFAKDPPSSWGPAEYVSLAAPPFERAAGRLRWAASRLVGQASASRVDRAILSSGIDLLWCLSAGTPSFAIPYITTVWDLQHRRQPVFPEVSTEGEWLRRETAIAREVGQAAIIIVGNETGQDEVQRFYGVSPERIRRLAHPTPEFAVQGASSRDMSRQDQVLAKYSLEPGYLFYPAQFWAHKNHVTLVRALRRLLDEHGTELHLVFVGSDKGNERFVRRLEQELGVTERVQHLGFVPQEDLVPLYQAALALGYVSYFGPENLPPLEAMALGCPVIAADVAGSHVQLGDAALLVSPSDDGAVAQALVRLLHEPGLKTGLVARGHERARAFTTPDYVEGMMRIMDELEPVIRAWR